MKEIILYGAGPVAEKLCRYIRRTWSEKRVVCFAVTDARGQKNFLDNIQVCPVEDALSQFPEAVLTSPEPSVLGFTEQGEALYGEETRSEQDIACIQSVQDGIYDYFQIYHRFVQKDVC